MGKVYIVTYKKKGQEGRFALEYTSIKEAIEALLYMDGLEVEEVEIFRSEPVTA